MSQRGFELPAGRECQEETESPCHVLLDEAAGVGELPDHVCGELASWSATRFARELAPPVPPWPAGLTRLPIRAGLPARPPTPPPSPLRIGSDQPLNERITALRHSWASFWPIQSPQPHIEWRAFLAGILPELIVPAPAALPANPLGLVVTRVREEGRVTLFGPVVAEEADGPYDWWAWEPPVLRIEAPRVIPALTEIADALLRWYAGMLGQRVRGRPVGGGIDAEDVRRVRAYLEEEYDRLAQEGATRRRHVSDRDIADCLNVSPSQVKRAEGRKR